MELRQLLEAMEPVATVLPPGKEVVVTGLAYDSRVVKPGDMFFCIEGFTTDGHLYAQEAVEKGAVAVVHSRPLDLPREISRVAVSDTRTAMGQASARFYGHPSSQLTVIGVTGTKGKTTTTYLIKAILESAGFTVGLIGTNQNLIGDRPVAASRTTPESLDLQHLFAQMLQAGCSHVVMEVSSHAVELGRTIGTSYDIGVFTNITRDHLDFHETFEHYLAAKTRFFTELSGNGKSACAIVNGDDSHSEHIIAQTEVPVLTYGIKGDWQLRAEDVQVSPRGVTYRLCTQREQLPLSLQLTGRFNVYNSLAAAAASLALGVEGCTVVKGLQSVSGVSGRFELLDLGQEYTVVVDYAHTPDSLQNVLETARALTRGRVIVAFGCGGNRDTGKRPEMGAIAARLADYVIITSDNPRKEDPVAICRDIEAGVKAVEGHAPYELLLDRQTGIYRAVEVAGPGDLVLIAGKGHETYQIFADRTIHFDDREVAAAAIVARGSGRS